MINTILGVKKEMNQAFVQGYRVPVTKVLAGPCVVTQIKKTDKDGYWAVQLGLGIRRTKNISKALQGHLRESTNKQIANKQIDKTTNTLPRFLAEVRLKEEPKYNIGDVVKAADIFKAGDVISVVGTSKGKGFAGGVKRHHFKGGPRTHGQSDRERAPGSIGQGTTPGRVYKGKRMAGRMGGDTVTVKNLHIISVSPETNEVVLSGAIPGTKGSLVAIKKTASGSLSDLEHETVTQVVVEGEPMPGAESPAPETAKQPDSQAAEQPVEVGERQKGAEPSSEKV